MRLFAIYNRAYKLRYFVADTIENALTFATKVGHIKRPNGFRRWVELTEQPPAELQPMIDELLAGNQPGVLVESEQGWQISS